jgi:hypothetical protein
MARPEEREEVGKRIDPETAKVFVTFADAFDPYGDDPQPEYASVGREHFAADPVENIWVNFQDLPEETREALYEHAPPSFENGRWSPIGLVSDPAGPRDENGNSVGMIDLEALR